MCEPKTSDSRPSILVSPDSEIIWLLYQPTMRLCSLAEYCPCLSTSCHLACLGPAFKFLMLFKNIFKFYLGMTNISLVRIQKVKKIYSETSSSHICPPIIQCSSLKANNVTKFLIHYSRNHLCQCFSKCDSHFSGGPQNALKECVRSTLAS